MIPKDENNLTTLSNWRPITLLNVDYKILAKVIAKRIESVLPKLIHSDQTGFIKGRFIGQNVRLLNDLLDYTDVKKIPGILLFIDFEKAFDVDDSINHVESVLKYDIDCVWDYAVKNEQYSRKNNLWVFGLEEEDRENLEEIFITSVRDHLKADITSEEIEIIHRIGPKKSCQGGEQGSRREGKPRPVIVKFHSNKSKMKILLKRKRLKGKGLVISEDMADDIAKRLKELKRKRSVESSWFCNGKIKYKQRDDPRVKVLTS